MKFIIIFMCSLQGNIQNVIDDLKLIKLNNGIILQAVSLNNNSLFRLNN